MDTQALTKQMKDLKAKARAARKAGKGDAATAFRKGSARAARTLRRVAPAPVKKPAAE